MQKCTILYSDVQMNDEITSEIEDVNVNSETTITQFTKVKATILLHAI